MPLWGPENRGEDNIKIDIDRGECEGVEWIYLA
jgi:hypothetical protein